MSWKYLETRVWILQTVTQNWTEVNPPPKEKEQTKQKENVN